jgi:hypothetical protein
MRARQNRRTGVIILSVAAALWCSLTSPSLPEAWRIPIVATGLLISGALIALAVKRGSENSGPFHLKIFWLSVGFEAVAIPLAIHFLIAAHQAAFILPVLTIIVGLHFVGMWLALERRLHLAICFGMCAAGLIAIFLTPPLRMQVAGFGSALTLWLAAYRIAGRAV